MWDFLVAYPQFQDLTLTPACFSSTVPGLHAGEGAERNRVYTGCVCQNEGKAQTKTCFCVVICTLGRSLFWELQHSFATQPWIRYERDLLLYPFLGGSVSPPTPQNADCLFFFATVICLLLSHLLVFYSNADSHSLLVPLFTSHTLVLSGCSVKRHFNIHDNPSPLVFRLTHQRAPHSFSEYLHAPSAVGKRSKNNDIIILMIVTITILLRSLPPNLHLSSPWIPTSEPSAGWSATEAGSAAFVSFFLSSSQVLPDPDKAELPQQPAVTKWWDPQQRGETDNSREIWEKKPCREPRTATLLSTNNFNSLKFLAGKMAAWRVIKIWL